MTARRGFTLVEMLVALLLTCTVLGSVSTVATVTARMATGLADRSEALAAVRAVGWVMQEELEGVAAGVDVSTPRADSISVRAFRGFAVVCAAVSSSAEIVVRWSGVRSPEPGKDTVLVFTPGDGWMPRRLIGRATVADRCGGDGLAERWTAERWTLDRPAASAVAARFFERGSYHLGDETLRYRIGQGGRQPLSPPNLIPSSTHLTGVGPNEILVEVAARGNRTAGSGPAWTRAFRLSGVW